MNFIDAAVIGDVLKNSCSEKNVEILRKTCVGHTFFKNRLQISLLILCEFKRIN